MKEGGIAEANHAICLEARWTIMLLKSVDCHTQSDAVQGRNDEVGDVRTHIQGL